MKKWTVLSTLLLATLAWALLAGPTWAKELKLS